MGAVAKKQAKRWWQDKEKLATSASELKFKIYYALATFISYSIFSFVGLIILALCLSALLLVGQLLGLFQLPLLNDKSCPPCYFCFYCLLKTKFLTN